MEEVLKQVANFMAVSARTAPKSGGKDFINIQIVKGEEVKRLGEAMAGIVVRNRNKRIYKGWEERFGFSSGFVNRDKGCGSDEP